MRTLAALVLVAVLAGGAGAAVPPPSAQEVQVGQQAAREIESRYRVVPAGPAVERVRRVGQAVAAVADRPGVTYLFKVIELDVPNAVALPDGVVYVTTAMLAFVRSDHELAAVLAHEIAHVARGHWMEFSRRQNQTALLTFILAALTRDAAVAQGLRLASIGILAHYTRDLERDADLTAITYLQPTAYTPVAVLTLMERIARLEQYRPSVDPGAFADHPTSAERVAYIEAELRRRGIPIVRRLSVNYLRLAVREADGAAELLVNETVIVRLPDAERVREAARRLDPLFNADLQPYEVGVREEGGGAWAVTARGRPVLVLTPRDGARAGTSARDLASQVQSRLREVIAADIRWRKLHG